MSPVASLKGSNGVAFLVAAGLVFEVIAAACSSPQTAEINADKRAATLMKWVNAGTAGAVGFIAIAAYVDREHAPAILLGGGLAAALMYGSYVHAKSAGLKDGKPGTES